MGQWPKSDVVFGIEMSGVSWPDPINDLLDSGDDLTTAVPEFLAREAGLSDDEFEWCGLVLAREKNLTLVGCRSGSDRNYAVLCLATSHSYVSGWDDWRRFHLVPPNEQDLENLRWAVKVLGVHPEVPEPSWMHFCAYG